MSKSTCLSKSLPMVVLVGLPLLSSLTLASETCKGMPEQSCGNQATCVWVQGYTRKDGRSVAGHCKAKAGTSSPDQAKPTR